MFGMPQDMLVHVFGGKTQRMLDQPGIHHQGQGAVDRGPGDVRAQEPHPVIELLGVEMLVQGKHGVQYLSARLCQPEPASGQILGKERFGVLHGSILNEIQSHNLWPGVSCQAQSGAALFEAVAGGFCPPNRLGTISINPH